MNCFAMSLTCLYVATSRYSCSTSSPQVNIVRTRKENPFVAMETDSVSSSSDNSNSMQINLSILVDMGTREDAFVRVHST